MAKLLLGHPPHPEVPFWGAQRALRIYYGLSCEHFPRRCACVPIVGCFVVLIFHADCSLNAQHYHHSIKNIVSGKNSFEKDLQKMRTNWKCEAV